MSETVQTAVQKLQFTETENRKKSNYNLEAGTKDPS